MAALFSKKTTRHLGAKGHHTKKYIFYVAFAITVIFMYAFYTQNNIQQQKEYKIVTETKDKRDNHKYLLKTSTCQILDLEPTNPDVIKYVYRESYTKCSSKPLLTYVTKSTHVTTLKINRTVLGLYSSNTIRCCVSEITRLPSEQREQSRVKLTPCVFFENETNFTQPFIYVECRTLLFTVYSNVHATIPLSESRKNTRKKNHDKYNVLLVGIDSISKLNLARTMPSVKSYLDEHFINVKGFNKIGDNTIPNLMAFLTGRNETQFSEFCNRTGKWMDGCPLVWKEFHERAYTTGYMEDETTISTFNYARTGFLNAPTDLYYRPYMLAAETTLTGYKRSGMSYCSGPETSGERVLNAARDFSVTLQDTPHFGLFWMNSFSHDNINLPSSMEEKIRQFLEDATFRASLKHTFFFFFSDHGFRFGNIRYTYTGWLEERLPFVYLHVPEEFKKRHREKYANLVHNAEKRLTTFYDLHVTLQDILKLADDAYEIQSSSGCPKCVSLFGKIPENRTCKDAAIDMHYCTCSAHKYLNSEEEEVKEIARFVVDEINVLISRFDEGTRCAEYSVNRIVSALASFENGENETVKSFLVMVETTPRAMFEATVEKKKKMYGERELSLLGGISRTDRYGDVSRCVQDAVLRKYCVCDVGLFTKVICTIFQC